MDRWNDIGESFSQFLCEAEQSAAAKEAGEKGYVHVGYGNWAREKGGAVIAKTDKKTGRLVPVSGADDGARAGGKADAEPGAEKPAEKPTPKRRQPPTEEKPKVQEPDAEKIRAAAQTQIAKLAKKFPSGPKGKMVKDMARLVKNPSPENINAFIERYEIKTNEKGNKMYDNVSNSFKESGAAIMRLIATQTMVPLRDWHMLAKPNHTYSKSKVVKAAAIDNGVEIGGTKITKVRTFDTKEVAAELVKQGANPREAKFRAQDLVAAAAKYNDKIETFQRIGEVEVADYSNFPGDTDAQQIGSAVIASLKSAMKRGAVKPDKNTRIAYGMIQKLSQSENLEEFEARYVELFAFVDKDKGPASIRPSLPLITEQFEAMYQTITGKQALIPMDEQFATADIISLSTDLPSLETVEDLAALDDRIDFIFAADVSVKLKAGGASSSSEKIKQTKFDNERVAKDCERLSNIVPDNHRPEGHHPSDYSPDQILDWKNGKAPHSKVGKELLGTIKRHRKALLAYYRMPPDTSVEQIFDSLSGGYRPKMGETHSKPGPAAVYFGRPDFDPKTPEGAWTTTAWQMHNVSGFVLEAIHNRHVSRQSYTNVSYTAKGIERTDGVRKLNAMKFQPYKTIEKNKTLGTTVPDGGMVSHIVSSTREGMQTAFTHKVSKMKEIKEQTAGPGEKKKSGGLARGGRVSQGRNRQDGRAGNGRYGQGQGAGVQGPEPMAKSGEPNKKEDELEKDYLEMDDEPLQPQSPLGKLVAQAFEQPIGEPKDSESDEEESDEDDVEEAYRNKSSRQGRSKARAGKRQVRIDRQAKKRKDPVKEAKGTRGRQHYSQQTKGGKYWLKVYRLQYGKGEFHIPRMKAVLVISNPDSKEREIPYPSVDAAKKAATEFYIRQDIREDYQGGEQTVTNADGKELEVDEDAYETAQKTEPTEVQQMDEPFTVQTKEGPAEGKKGDYLAKGVDGEQWPIDQAIFDKTHEFVDPEQQNTPATAAGAVRPPQTNEVKGLAAPDFEMEVELDEAGTGSYATGSYGIGLGRGRPFGPFDAEPPADDTVNGKTGNGPGSNSGAGTSGGTSEATATKDRTMTPARAKVLNRYNSDPKFKAQLDNAWSVWRNEYTRPAEKQKAAKFLKSLGLVEAMREASKKPRTHSGVRVHPPKQGNLGKMREGTVVQVRPDLWAAKNQLDEVKHFTSRKIAEMFANSRGKNSFGLWPSPLNEEPGGRWKTRARHFRPEGDEDAKTLARGMVSVDEAPDHLSSGGGTSSGSDRHSTFLGKGNLSPEEMKVIDDNWKTILKFAATAFEKKPLPVALRTIEKYLEKLGIDPSHSMKIGDLLAKQLNKDRDPVSMIIPKVIPKIQQEPYTKGSGYSAGGIDRAQGPGGY